MGCVLLTTSYLLYIWDKAKMRFYYNADTRRKCYFLGHTALTNLTSVTVWAKTCQVCTFQYFKKYHLKIQFKALPSYWTDSLSIIVLNYLLAFVQLTWLIDDWWFFPMIISMEFINIGPAYIRGWAGGCGVRWVVAKA